jgi:hypothetical protein
MNVLVEARLLRLHMLINGIFIRNVIPSRHVTHTTRSPTVFCPAHVSHQLIPSRCSLCSLDDPIDGETVMNVRDWASSRIGFEATVRLAHETGFVLFGNCTDVGGTLSEDVEASRNCLVTGDLYNLQN